MDAVEVIDRPASPPAVIEEVETTLASPLETRVHDTLRGLVAGDLAALPVFVPLLFAYFEEDMPTSGRRAELAAHLSRKAAAVLGTLFAAAQEQEKQVVVMTRRPLDFAMGACAATPAWKLAALYAVDTFGTPTDATLAALAFALAVASEWQWTDALAYAAIFWARGRYASLEAGFVMCAAGAVCTLVG
jgi:hypothetical protein